MRTLTRRSPAKINLTLRVVRRLAGGYHEIESLVTWVDLCDTLTVRPRDDGRFTVACDDASIPCDDTNLAVRAAQALRRRVVASGSDLPGVDINISKRIPAGGGLGGGSSNAATTLLLLNELWELGLSNGELAETGAGIGADVPLFLQSPLCVMRGRGERIEPLSTPLDAWVTLVFPGIHCDTRRVYKAWRDVRQRSTHPPLKEIVAAFDDPEGLMPLLFNDLQTPALAEYPDLAAHAADAAAVTGRELCMTGSGSTLFRLFAEQTEATAFCSEVTAATGMPATATRVGTAPGSA